MTAYAYSGGAGSTVTLPTVVGARWTEVGLYGGLVLTGHDFADVSDVVTSPGAMSWEHTGAVENAEFTGGAFVFEHDDSTADSWYGGTYTGPYYFATVPNASAMAVLAEAHIASADADAIVVRNDVGLMIAETGDDAKFAALVLQGLPAGNYLSTQTGPSTNAGTISRTDGQLDTGHWLRLVVLQDGSIQSWYVAASAASRPAESAWVALGFTNEFFTPGEVVSLRIGFSNLTPGGASVVTPWTISGFRIAVARTVAIT